MKVNFEELYDRFFRDVYLFILAMSKEYRHFRGSCSVKSWLCQIAKNLYISDTRRKKPVHSETLDELPDASDVEEICIRKDDALSIYKVLHCLSEPYKEVFTLRVLGDLSYKEIAEIFGKQETWARVTYHRAKLKIQEHFPDESFRRNR